MLALSFHSSDLCLALWVGHSLQFRLQVGPEDMEFNLKLLAEALENQQPKHQNVGCRHAKFCGLQVQDAKSSILRGRLAQAG